MILAIPRLRPTLAAFAFLLLLLSAPRASASVIETGFNIVSPNVCPTPPSVSYSGSPLSFSTTCTAGNAFITLSGSAGIGNLGGSAEIEDTSPQTGPVSVQLYVSSSYTDTVTFTGVGTVTCPPTPGVADCPVSGVQTLPADTQLNVVMVFSLNGTYSYSDINYADIDPATDVYLNSQYLLVDTSQYKDCPGTNPCSGAAGAGTISATLVTTPFSLGGVGAGAEFTIGQGYYFATEFYDQLNCNTDGNCEGDFLDPTLTDVEITDPANGLVVNGISLTGDNGVVYPVNQAVSTPEPGGIGYIAGLAIVSVGLLRRRRSTPGVSPAVGNLPVNDSER
jgi:hypothetical protein